ncbi:MAG: diguanylate cyclase domain-containing protein [bacterium]
MAILLSIIVIVGGGLATYVHIQSQIQARFEEIKTRAYSMGQVIGLQFSDPLLTGGTVEERLEIQMNVWLSEIPNTRFLIVYNSEGKKIFTTFLENSEENYDLDLPGTAIGKLLAGSRSSISRRLDNKQVLDMLIPIRLFRTDFGVVRLGFDVSHFEAERQQMYYRYGLAGSLLLVIIFYVSHLLAGFLIKPIERLETITTRFGEGDLKARADISTGDEIQRLGKNFNQMADNLQEKIEDLHTIQELNRKISAKLRPEDLHDHIVNVIKETWQLQHIALLMFEKDNFLKMKAGLNVPRDKTWKKKQNSKIFNLLDAEGFCRRHQSKKSRDCLRPVLGLNEEQPLKEVLSFKLVSGSTPLGYLLLARETCSFSEDELNLLKILTHQIKIALDNARHYTRAVTDELTDLYNRRFFDLQLKKSIDDPDSQPVSLAMIDIDNFKHYNDTYGHPAGDEVLEKLGDTFKKQVRTVDTHGTARRLDLVARYGGEEFCIILPSTNNENACSVADRIRQSVEDINHFEEQITISVGIATSREGETADKLLLRADEALYKAKREGKNQVCPAD